MKELCIASNMYNEIDQLEGWLKTVRPITDKILIVDSGSKDGTIDRLKEEGVIVIINDIIHREGYGPARQQLRMLSKQYFPKAEWMMFLDADERINSSDHHHLRFLRDYLIDDYDVVAFPRIDWMDEAKTQANNDYRVSPDWQGRMTRLNSPLRYVKKLHEQIINCRGIYAEITNPKINHFHRSAPQKKRDEVGKVCAKLHHEDTEWGHTYGKHHKEDAYYEMFLKEGL
jgi:glycosyltransferase involved in cell wall biosynthesis